MTETTNSAGNGVAEQQADKTKGGSKPAPVDPKDVKLSEERNTHIRFVGDTATPEGDHTVVFGKRFQRGVWVPITNLDGTNPEKKALLPSQIQKLVGNPAFELGTGEDKAVPGPVEAAEEVHEDA